MKQQTDMQNKMVEMLLKKKASENKESKEKNSDDEDEKPKESDNDEVSSSDADDYIQVFFQQ